VAYDLEDEGTIQWAREVGFSIKTFVLQNSVADEKVVHTIKVFFEVFTQMLDDYFLKAKMKEDKDAK
jgi:hypothetical protein